MVKIAVRILFGIVVCLGIAMGIACFAGLGLGTQEIQEAFDTGAVQLLTGSVLSYLLTPYTMYAALGVCLPLVAWAAGGFVGGLITMSPLKAAIMALVSVAIAWLVLSFLSGSMAGQSFSETIRVLLDETRGMARDLGTALGACVIPAVIGGAITKQHKIPYISPGPQPSASAKGK